MNITGPANKIIRAGQHYAYLQKLIHEYLSSTPYEINVVAELEHSGYLVTTTHTPPPPDIGLVFGDVVHNLRSALDHYARLMVMEAGGTPIDRGRGTMFPILSSRPANGPSVSGGISEERLLVLDGLQPYQLGERYHEHPLWKLSELDNIDKHRLVQIVAMSGIANVVFLPADHAEISLQPEMNRYLISLDSTAPQHIQVAPEDLYEQAQATGHYTTAVKLADDEFCGGQQPYILGMQLFEAVDKVIDEFASLSASSDEGASD